MSEWDQERKCRDQGKTGMAGWPEATELCSRSDNETWSRQVCVLLQPQPGAGCRGAVVEAGFNS